MAEDRDQLQPPLRIKTVTLTPGTWVYVCPCGFETQAGRVFRRSSGWMVYCFKCKQQNGKYYQVMDERIEFNDNPNGKLNCQFFPLIRLHNQIKNAVGSQKQIYLKGVYKATAVSTLRASGSASRRPCVTHRSIGICSCWIIWCWDTPRSHVNLNYYDYDKRAI